MNWKIERPQEIAPESPKNDIGLLWDSLHPKDGVLYRKWRVDDEFLSLATNSFPKSRIQEVLQERPATAQVECHFGVMKAEQNPRVIPIGIDFALTSEKWCREVYGSPKGPKQEPKAALQRYNVGAPSERMALIF
ncbi:hypothetical protein AVEN_177343-1 [Araneus ventricosus]|uniref:Uncharacterized protein n=1 Tax=Araneus ventricosus TaxID=182803 RepID=A0A4Y2QH29_ARAVE|nr:hypothetical protein AVEN_177343-1 [Araneus ventricosus]